MKKAKNRMVITDADNGTIFLLKVVNEKNVTQKIIKFCDTREEAEQYQ